MKQIYADNAATTFVTDEILGAMMPFLTGRFGNPSSIYRLGMDALRGVEHARKQCADAIGAKPNEIYFTSGGSEADNWAIKETARRLKNESGKNHIITTNFEHHAVLHTCQALEREGFDVTYLPVDERGLITAAQVEAALTDKTAIVSIMYANNEIGTLLPIAEIGEICRNRNNKVIFHTDAVQAVGNIHIDVKSQNIDMMSVSGHKIHAPKGIGFLYCKNGINLRNFIHGGGQERGKRAGTENTAGIAALGLAMEIATRDIQAKAEKVAKMRDRLISELSKIPASCVNGDLKNRLPGNVNLSFIGVEGESLLLNMDLKGISASSGSACTSGSLDPSHVLLALGLPHEIAHGSCRITINEYNTDEEIDIIIKEVPEIISKIRSMSPLWEDFVNGKDNAQRFFKWLSPIK
ncbi:MAG: cysteine desulfurase NifS [Ruminococcus sp.]|jgi:cysteine desulfurase|nr:cysteine desulfurase NifS [Ruminococcus sp.]